jgi:hypothetical protein
VIACLWDFGATMLMDKVSVRCGDVWEVVVVAVVVVVVVVVATQMSAEFTEWITTVKLRIRQRIRDLVNAGSHQGVDTNHAMATELVKVLSPAYALLRSMDSDKGPMGTLYNTWTKVGCMSLQFTFFLDRVKWCTAVVTVVTVVTVVKVVHTSRYSGGIVVN